MKTEGGKRVKNKKRKVKDENVSYFLLETVTLMYLVSTHLCLCTLLSLLLLFLPPFSPYVSLPSSLSQPLPLTLCFPFVTLVSIPHYFSLVLSFIPCSLTSKKKKKTSHAQFGVHPVKLALNAHTHQHILL